MTDEIKEIKEIPLNIENNQEDIENNTTNNENIKENIKENTEIIETNEDIKASNIEVNIEDTQITNDAPNDETVIKKPKAKGRPKGALNKPKHDTKKKTKKVEIVEDTDEDDEVLYEPTTPIKTRDPNELIFQLLREQELAKRRRRSALYASWFR